ncbi:NAD(P)/FAD-dependent oxidoreductase [Gordonia sp. NPDC058843]|uniref:NAD(P)/FAD-dependent oxidoreductase n=1 Tax=Gordonia sp. NPDC058843 TaxID=3346648 RepID=UPI0036A70AF6
MTEILIVGGGYAGLYTALHLEKSTRRRHVHVTLVDPRPYMTYQPFLPEVVSGAVEPRHTLVSLRRHLRTTTLVPATVTDIDHAHRTVRARALDGRALRFDYDIIVVTAGAVTRTFAIPGLAEHAIGLKNVEEAVAIRDRLLTAFERAAVLPDGPERARLLTVTFVGGGFSGVEGFGEALSLATEQLRYYPEIRQEELEFHLIEARDRILPEVTDKPGRWVVERLRTRGAHVHLNTQLVSAVGGHVVLSTGEAFDSDLIVWTAGNAANGVVANHTDLPVDDRGYLVTRPDLRIGTDDAIVADAWAAGDNAAIPDLAVGNDTLTVPNAQHAVRQARLLAANIAAVLDGDEPRNYTHAGLGVVATLGRGDGLFQYKRLVIRGWPAWAMHRGYHVLAVPTWERKVRVLLGWFGAFVGRRDIVSPATTVTPFDAPAGTTPLDVHVDTKVA